jgi:hypothetical protein
MGEPGTSATTLSSAMGQPVTVIEKPSSRAGIVRFEINRALTGTGHEVYLPDREITGDRPPDVLAKRLFERGGIDRIHINSNVITIELGRGQAPDGISDVVADLYTYYRPGVPVPVPEDFATEEEG